MKATTSLTASPGRADKTARSKSKNVRPVACAVPLFSFAGAPRLSLFFAFPAHRGSHCRPPRLWLRVALPGDGTASCTNIHEGRSSPAPSCAVGSHFVGLVALPRWQVGGLLTPVSGETPILTSRPARAKR